ncbi:MAG: hypothetical protein ACU85E_17665 [Gammaproteobacteria bacterium]
MKLLPAQTDEHSLSSLGKAASAMLMRHDYSGLVNRFGYARAFDRDPATAIEADYSRAAASHIEAAPNEHFQVTVKYFKPNSTGLFAVVECIVPVAERAAVLLELIVTEKGEEKHIAVEDISGIAV